MPGTRWKPLLRHFLGEVHRELKITLTPVPKPKKWAFIVGCYNSGTTLLSEILSRHPRIGSLPTEGHFLTDQFPSEYDMGISRMWIQREDLFHLTEEDTGPDVIRLKKEWGMRMQNRSRPVLLEKSPQNGARMRWLQKHFENAYFISMIRNPYAVAEGISRKANPECQTGRWPVTRSAEQWCRSNQVIENDGTHIKYLHWVRYEDFTQDPQNELKKIFDFLGLGSDNSVELNAEWSIHERSESIKNLNKESIARLSNEDIVAINHLVGDCISHFGYPLLEGT